MTGFGVQAEEPFQRKVLDLASATAWTLQYHTFDSRRSAKGFPDLVLCRAPELVFAELKGEKTRVTEEQIAWIAGLRACGVEAYLWRPADWSEIEERLTRPRLPVPILHLTAANLQPLTGNGCCPHCESENIEALADADSFRCGQCGASWRGVRRRLAEAS